MNLGSRVAKQLISNAAGFINSKFVKLKKGVCPIQYAHKKVQWISSEDALERKAHDANHVKSIFENFLKIDTEIDTVALQKTRKSRRNWLSETVQSYMKNQTLPGSKKYLSRLI